MSLRFLLDTSIVSSPISKFPDFDILARLETHGHECAIGAPVWHELVYGCRRLPAGKRREAIETYLHAVVERSFPILAYDVAAAYWHGAERARMERLGRIAPFVDGQIAAITNVNDLTLVTVNVKDFAHFNDVTIENWSRRNP